VAGMTELLRRIADVPTQFFAARVTGSSASVFRIAFGALAAWNALTLVVNTERYFSDAGAYPWDLAGAHKSWGAFAHAPHDIDHAYTVLLAYVIVSLLLMFGVFSRISCAALWYLQLSVWHRNSMIMSDADTIFGILLFLGIFLPLGRRWSVDAWFMRRLAIRWPTLFERVQRRLPSIWSARLLQLQIAMIYGMTAYAKLHEDVWQEGQAIRGFLAMPTYSTWPMWHDPWPFMKPLTWGTLAFECAFPLLIWFRPLRRWLLLAGIAFHVGIEVLMQVPLFSATMICAYIMFVPDETVERWMNAIEQRIGRMRRQASGASS
jgi:hypothetical protein